MKKEFLEDLVKSGLNDGDAKLLGFKLMDSPPIGLTKHPAPGYQIPYFDVAGKRTEFYRYRYLQQPKMKGWDALIQPNAKQIRYTQPANQSPRVYFPKNTKNWKDIIKDPTESFCITEGEKKAACACKFGIATIGLGGVWNWQSMTETFIPDLEQIEWAERVVYIVFDSDAVTNPQVMLAENRFCAALLKRGAMPHVVRIPESVERKIGLDDLLVDEGKEAFNALLPGEEYGPARELHRMNDEVVYIDSLSRILQRKTNHMYTRNDFVGGAYANWIQDDSSIIVDPKTGNEKKVTKKRRTAVEWLEWAHRAQVQRIVYHPGKPKLFDGNYNSYNGLAVEPIKGDVGPWTKFLDYLFHEVPIEHRTWFERWLAYPLQHPGTKMLTATIVNGNEQGVGKTLVGKTMCKIYGDNSTVISGKHMFQRFNNWAANKMFIMADEIAGGDDKRLSNDKLKSMITETLGKIEKKNVDEYDTPDFIQYFFNSNHPDPIHLDENDRRFFVHTTQFKALPDPFYIAFDEWKETTGPAALLYHLLNLDLGDFNPQSRAPMTPAKQIMIRELRSELANWVSELKAQPEVMLDVIGQSKATLMTCAEVLMAYAPSGSQHGKPVTAQGMGRAMASAGFKRANSGSGINIGDGNGTRWLWIVGGDKEKLAKMKHNELADIYNKEHPQVKKKFKTGA